MRREYARRRAPVMPRIEAFRSMTGDAFRTEIALMLERLGHTVISSINDIVTTKQGRKCLTTCATPSDQTPTRTDQPTLASISALRNRSITSMKPTDGTSSTSTVIAAI
jgi:hypothetical protein